MFTSQHALRTVVVVGLTGAAGLSLAPAASSRPVPSGAAERAIAALVSDEPAIAAASMPPDFGARFGYRPAVSGELLGDPSGGCSSPVPLPDEFENACRQHDLGYDLLRYAGRSGHALAPDARRSVDTRLGVELEDSCGGRDSSWRRAECLAWAEVATGFVRINSARQGFSPPESETPLSIAPGVALGVAALGAVGLALPRLRARMGRASAASWSHSGTKSSSTFTGGAR
ncbi:hypothetical protein N802_09285 [Knoellia sinensis KCTC 19936]|uniref:Phospholipase A2 n=1 Tax=Knoellia sinensis KCTC 19936 TaxID=1385520 RepID=A0A0A0IZQ6_9MICO|nr:hypothetical protein [Knoellia sinensis]KGN30293.1 hypothetical protein N802_09285 [Knoellia sinensis KCTC 19936]